MSYEILLYSGSFDKLHPFEYRKGRRTPKANATEGQAIAYMRNHCAMPDTKVISEVERYIVTPGLACSFMVGFLEIMRLREEAKTALGEDFDLRQFHRVLFGHGNLPLPLLNSVVVLDLQL